MLASAAAFMRREEATSVTMILANHDHIVIGMTINEFSDYIWVLKTVAKELDSLDSRFLNCSTIDVHVQRTSSHAPWRGLKSGAAGHGHPSRCVSYGSAYSKTLRVFRHLHIFASFNIITCIINCVKPAWLVSKTFRKGSGILSSLSPNFYARTQ